MGASVVRLAAMAAVLVVAESHGLAQAQPRLAQKPLRDVTLAEALAARPETLAVAYLGQCDGGGRAAAEQDVGLREGHREAGPYRAGGRI
jgi:hypothetical protein